MYNVRERKVLFVAIDRTIRLVYIVIKDKKDAYNAEAFLKELIQFYPYKIHIVLTDNGKEFTDRFVRQGRRHQVGMYLTNAVR